MKKLEALWTGISIEEFLRFIFYGNIILVEALRPVEVFGRWLPFFGHDRYSFLPEIFFSTHGLLVLKVGFLLSAALMTLSIRTEASSLLAFFIGSLYYLTLYSIDFEQHHLHLVWHVLLVFCFFENSKFFGVRDLILLVRTLWVFAFFSAGITKLMNIGGEWFSADTPLFFLLRQRLMSPLAFNLAENDLNLIFARNIKIFAYFFSLALPLELISPLALFKRGRPLVLLFAMLQIISGFIFGAQFIEWISVYFFWFNYSTAGDLHKNEAEV